jgi:hypothetical protein
MLYYPKIPGSRNAPLKPCIAFEKFDGTNLHWEWDRELGWHRFGTRRDQFEFDRAGIEMFQNRHFQLAEAPEVFQESLAASIDAILRDVPTYREEVNVRVFAEFFGLGSFAGLHREADPKELRLIDVWLGSAGFVGPAQFVGDFGQVGAARVVYRGKLTGRFADDVRHGRYGVNEGVVCKGGNGGSDLWMAKIKTHAYLARLKEAFADRWEEHWE